MSEEILINVTPRETRAALVQNGILQEVYIERESYRGLVGNIYKGRVNRVLPGMEAAFVDIGLERAGFLHLSNIHESRQATGQASISDILQVGQVLLVQIIKDPMGSKGARLTTCLSIPSRYLVYMPLESHIAFSQRIEDESEKHRIQVCLEQIVQADQMKGGVIVRTAAEGLSYEELHTDLSFLQKIWEEVKLSAEKADPESNVYEDLPLPVRVIRDLFHSDLDKIRVDSTAAYREVMRFSEKFIPEAMSKVEHYTGDRPIFDIYSVEDEIKRALGRKVMLKSGGYIVIDQTEAMTTIDVNTGGFVGAYNQEETTFKTNLEAAQTIAHQLRLRNLGGIIILDFIDMQEEDHRQQVLHVLQRELEKDRARTSVCEVSSLGLVEMTRKRTRESLGHVLCQVCPTCEGRGVVRTVETICNDICREIVRISRQFEADRYLVMASQAVVERMTGEDTDSIAELEAFINCSIRFRTETFYQQEQYDVVPM